VTALPIPSAALVASAVSYQVGKAENVFRPITEWQKEAWRQYDICSELAFAAGWIGNAMSRCQLVPGIVDDTGQVQRDDNQQTADALTALFAGSQGQSEMLMAAGIHFSIAGEFYIVGRKMNDGNYNWEVIGCNQVMGSGRNWTLLYGDGINPVNLTDNDVVIRVWRPHPVRRYEAYSPVLPLLPVLKELEFLTRHLFAQTQSRLTGAGVWVLPASVEFPESQGVADKAAGMLKWLGKAMMTPLSQPDSAASLIPNIITVPDELLGKIGNPIHFWSPFDEQALAARREAIMRFCVGMDLPPEVVLGMTRGASSSGGHGTGASHWTAWQIEEAAIKLHIEPLLSLLCNSLTMEYLRVVSDNPKAAIFYDTNALKLQPDRSKEALELSDRGKLSDEALIVYSGFAKDDLADEDTQKRFLLRRLAGASATPDQVAWALGELGLTGAPTGGTEALPPGSNQAQTPSLEDHPNDNGGPPSGYSRSDVLMAVSEPLVLRALERVGNRLRQSGARPDCDASETHCYAVVNGSAQKYLDGAWTMVPKVCTGIADPVVLTRVLNAYVENLLAQQAPHTREGLTGYLKLLEQS
jgi:hypothetical protein